MSFLKTTWHIQVIDDGNLGEKNCLLHSSCKTSCIDENFQTFRSLAVDRYFCSAYHVLKRVAAQMFLQIVRVQ